MASMPPVPPLAPPGGSSPLLQQRCWALLQLGHQTVLLQRPPSPPPSLPLGPPHPLPLPLPPSPLVLLVEKVWQTPQLVLMQPPLMQLLHPPAAAAAAHPAGRCCSLPWQHPAGPKTQHAKVRTAQAMKNRPCCGGQQIDNSAHARQELLGWCREAMTQQVHAACRIALQRTARAPSGSSLSSLSRQGTRQACTITSPTSQESCHKTPTSLTSCHVPQQASPSLTALHPLPSLTAAAMRLSMRWCMSSITLCRSAEPNVGGSLWALAANTLRSSLVKSCNRGAQVWEQGRR